MRTTLGSFGIWSDCSASDGYNRDRRNAGSESDRSFSDSGQFLPNRKAEWLEAQVVAASSCEIAAFRPRTWKVCLLSALGACSERQLVTKTKEAG